MRDRPCPHRFVATNRIAHRSLAIVRFPEVVVTHADVRSAAIGSRRFASRETAAAVRRAAHIGHFARASTESQPIPFEPSR
ncbi:hypothetical protein WG70_11640 [Burkholderia oklahomensis EO147]|nr:hypothetical protein WG70_11640 [Burkholderia oklahomensis EO147]AOI49824.1 hypothetical protein WI23_29385 [Burkholderia oklahomensis C6786]KUY47302.1 hypothetical protein WI23_30370 [Burkholderia oklahomensis C6786]KUY48766.1 hypothetical protein WG70_21580 [Burkholderia oklahomensis EO147]